MSEPQQNNFFQRLAKDYGKDCLHLVRDLERTGRKISRYQNHLRLTLQCKHTDVTPVSLKLKTSMKGMWVNNILYRAERSLMSERILQINFTKDILDRKFHDIECQLRDRLPSDVYKTILDSTQNAMRGEHFRC